jgi:hypothetical protein
MRAAAVRPPTSSRAAPPSCCSRSGPTAAAGATSAEEARNLDGDASFVAREAMASGFDDVVHWGSIHALAHRMVSAGRLP